MKNDRVFLAEWLGDSADGYNDIPWPLIHEHVGNDAVRWLNSQSPDRVQMVLERGTDFSSGRFKLYAEFFQPALRSEFALRFAK
jgi:hypothetical protein